MKYYPDTRKINEHYACYFRTHPLFERRMIQGGLPFIEFRVYEDWQPNATEVLFVAESPPETGYFYDVNSPGIGRVSDNIFHLLSMDTNKPKKVKLEEFRDDDNRFLVDVVKCRKKGGGGIPKSLVRFCGEHLLSDEIEGINPATIVLLGGSALTGLRLVEGFGGIGSDKSIEDLAGTEEQIKMGSRSYRVIYSVFPSSRNILKYGWKRFIEAFEMI